MPIKLQPSRMPVRLLVLASARRSCSMKLLRTEEAKAELDRFMVASPANKLLRFLPIVRELSDFLSGACELASTTTLSRS